MFTHTSQTSQTPVQICVVTPALSRNVVEIDVNALYGAVLSNEPLLIIDLRHKADYVSSHIPRAISQPAIQGGAVNLRRFCQAGVRTILYSYAGVSPTTKLFADELAQLGFSVEVLSGGWEAWSSANLPLDNSGAVNDGQILAGKPSRPSLILFNPDWIAS